MLEVDANILKFNEELIHENHFQFMLSLSYLRKHKINKIKLKLCQKEKSTVIKTYT
jgi:hypothetical protein